MSSSPVNYPRRAASNPSLLMLATVLNVYKVKYNNVYLTPRHSNGNKSDNFSIFYFCIQIIMFSLSCKYTISPLSMDDTRG